MGRSVFEHVTQEFLHGSVSDGAVEEQQLYPLRGHEAQRGQKEKQLSKPRKKSEKKKTSNESINMSKRGKLIGFSLPGRTVWELIQVRQKFWRATFSCQTSEYRITKQKKGMKIYSGCEAFSVIFIFVWNLNSFDVIISTYFVICHCPAFCWHFYDFTALFIYFS